MKTVTKATPSVNYAKKCNKYIEYEKQAQNDIKNNKKKYYHLAKPSKRKFKFAQTK